MNWLIFDVETTGLNYEKSFAISIGAMLFNDETGEKSEFYELFNWTLIPNINFYIPEDTIDVHGITIEKLQSAKNSYHPVKVANHLFNWIMDFMEDKEGQKIDGLVAFNSSFDISIMRANLLWLTEVYLAQSEPGGGYEDENISLDTSEIEKLYQALRLFTKREDGPLFIDSRIIDKIFHFETNGVKNRHNLEDVGLRYGLEKDEMAHHAMYDVRRLAQIFEFQLKEIREKGLALDSRFEQRLARKWTREKNRFRNSKDKDYFGLEVEALKV